MKYTVDVTLKPHADPFVFQDAFHNWLCHNAEAEDLIALVSFDGVEIQKPPSKMAPMPHNAKTLLLDILKRGKFDRREQWELQQAIKHIEEVIR